MSKKSTGVSSDDVPDRVNVDVSYADDIVTEGVKTPSTKDLGENVDPSVKDTMDGLKDGSSSRGDVLEPTVNDSVKDTIVESMDVDRPSDVGTEHVTAKYGYVVPEEAGQEKKSKKMKHKKSAKAGESSEPKRKISKEERDGKMAMKAARRAMKATEKAADDDVHEESEDHVPK
ncbi:hypothetical protein LIER_09551 [Lithospermum erythrorhizon]|uniref:Uncharacterized protein n=1 Tax=Lithospermum erythrorhizon TaxID=34254 RepID=A0AAV3PK02_LITER